MKSGLIKTSFRTGLLATLMTFASSAGQATEVPLFSADAYGKSVLPLNESLGKAAVIIRKQGNIFEPLSQLRRDDPLRVGARAIGRLDLLVENGARQALVTCTASIISQDLLLTNHHCIPGKNGRIIKASLLLDYEKSDGSGTTRLEVEPRLIEGDADLDYSLARLKSPVPADIKPLNITPLVVKPRQQLLMIHHPAGQVKKMSRFQCRASKSTIEAGTYLRHICESLPGSSGGILFNTRTGAVGLHHSGGLDKNDPDSFNKGTLLAKLVAASQALKSVASVPSSVSKQAPVSITSQNNRQQVPLGSPGSQGEIREKRGTTGNINDILTQP